MKTKAIDIIILALIALGSRGCSSSPRIYYWGDKAYAKNPRTGKILSWEHKESEGRGYRDFGTGFGRRGGVPSNGFSGAGIMSGYTPKIDCSNMQIPCNIK